MKNYSSKQAKRGRVAYRTPSRFLNSRARKISKPRKIRGF